MLTFRKKKPWEANTKSSTKRD